MVFTWYNLFSFTWYDFPLHGTTFFFTWFDSFLYMVKARPFSFTCYDLFLYMVRLFLYVVQRFICCFVSWSKSPGAFPVLVVYSCLFRSLFQPLMTTKSLSHSSITSNRPKHCSQRSHDTNSRRPCLNRPHIAASNFSSNHRVKKLSHSVVAFAFGHRIRSSRPVVASGRSSGRCINKSLH